MLKTHWIIVTLGLWIAAAGAAALYFSLDLLGTERGSLYAMGGTVGLVGGALVLSLGLALRRFEIQANRLSARLAKVTEAPPKSARAKGAEKAAFAGDTLAAPPRPPVAAAASPATAADAPQAVRISRAPPDFLLRGATEGSVGPMTAGDSKTLWPDPLVASILAETATGAGGTAADMPQASNSPDHEALPPDGQEPLAALGPANPSAPLSPTAASQPPARPAAVAASRPIDFAALAPPVASALASVPRPDAFHPGDGEHMAAPNATSAPPPRAAAVVALPPSQAALDSEPPLFVSYASQPTVVGRYNAGGAAYTMYSDGAIEAETETGNYRFSSMKELREFIEQRTHLAGAQAD